MDHLDSGPQKCVASACTTTQKSSITTARNVTFGKHIVIPTSTKNSVLLEPLAGMFAIPNVCARNYRQTYGTCGQTENTKGKVSEHIKWNIAGMRLLLNLCLSNIILTLRSLEKGKWICCNISYICSPLKLEPKVAVATDQSTCLDYCLYDSTRHEIGVWSTWRPLKILYFDKVCV